MDKMYTVDIERQVKNTQIWFKLYDIQLGKMNKSQRMCIHQKA